MNFSNLTQAALRGYCGTILLRLPACVWASECVTHLVTQVNIGIIPAGMKQINSVAQESFQHKDVNIHSAGGVSHTQKILKLLWRMLVCVCKHPTPEEQGEKKNSGFSFRWSCVCSYWKPPKHEHTKTHSWELSHAKTHKSKRSKAAQSHLVSAQESMWWGFDVAVRLSCDLRRHSSLSLTFSLLENSVEYLVDGKSRTMWSADLK